MSTLNRLNGAAGSSNMFTGTTRAVGAGELTSALNDKAGIYLAGGSFTIDEAYFGLGDGRFYRVTLTP